MNSYSWAVSLPGLSKISFGIWHLPISWSNPASVRVSKSSFDIFTQVPISLEIIETLMQCAYVESSICFMECSIPNKEYVVEFCSNNSTVSVMSLGSSIGIFFRIISLKLSSSTATFSTYCFWNISNSREERSLTIWVRSISDFLLIDSFVSSGICSTSIILIDSIL